MITYYTLHDGSRIAVLMWYEFLENNPVRKHADVFEVKNGKLGNIFKKEISANKRGLYITVNNEKVYLNSFDYLPAEQLSNKIQNAIDNDTVSDIEDDEILATFMRDADNVGLVCNLPAYKEACKPLKVELINAEDYTVFCIPTERDHEKKNWSYKVTIECWYKPLREYITSTVYSFEDLCKMIRHGEITIVDKKDFVENMKNYMSKQKESEKTFAYKIKKVLGMNEDNDQKNLLYAGIK